MTNTFRIIVTKEFLLLKALITLIYLLLEVYYHFYISQQFDYMLYADDLNLLKHALTKVVFFFLLIGSFNMYKTSKFLYSIYLLLIFFFYIPNAILFSLGNFSIGPFVSNTFFVAFFLLTPFFKIQIPQFSVASKYKTPILISLSLLLLAPIAITFGINFNLKTLVLSEVYETRELFSKSLTGALAYFYNLEAKTVIPFALAFFLINRKYFFVVLSFLVLIYLYVISGNKIVYFTSLIVVFFYIFGKDFVSKLNNLFLAILILFITFPVIDNFVLETPILSGTFVNRFLFIPALLTQFYFDFFDGRPFFFAESHFFSNFITSPYDMPVGFLITKEYWNEPTVYANNGIVSDGFMNLGFIGVFIFSIVFSTLFSFFNKLNIHRGYYGVFFCYIFIILSTPLMSTFITGGILIFIILSVLLLNNTQTKEE